ncbi:MAG: RdgB/HAM1 family non-canonical purine NTP pyrophosphatase [Clostridia bacterium]|nr:RdgB/HAM1 family non-canonical purine NTP pyrophosphatase [Clostridia bacterium]
MRLIMATNNQGKVKELSALLSSDFEVLTLKEAGFEIEVEEDGTTFTENAVKKALETYKITKTPSIGDDSGLCVEALSGAPGIYSARWAGEGATQDELIGKLHSELSEKENKNAKFVSVIALAFSEDDIVIAEGECHGIIIDEKRGTGGFGYDPVFYVPSLGKTFSELTIEEKNKISHRANALFALCDKLKMRGVLK